MTRFKFKDYARPQERIIISKSVYLEGELPEHTHDFIELVYVSGGNGVHVLNGVKRPVRQGDFLIIGENSVHTFYPSANNFTWINCCFLPQIMERLCEASPSDRLALSLVLGRTAEAGRVGVRDRIISKLPPEIGRLFETMFREYNHRGAHYQSILERYLHILLLKISPYAAEPDAEAALPYAPTDDLETVVSSFFGRTTSFENIRTADIAGALYMTPKYLSNLFKKKTGRNLSDFIRQIKLERACTLLRSSRMNVQDVITMVGYSDSKFFYAIFKQYTGMTPGEYRRACEGRSDTASADNRN